MALSTDLFACQKPSPKGSNQVVYDVELLYDLYHTLEDETEKSNVERLIKENLPEAPGQNYEKSIRELFTGDYMPYFPDISCQYPEVSRMLLKHKKSIWEKIYKYPDDCLEPELLDAFIGRIKTISQEDLEFLMKSRDPRKLIPLFAILKNKPKSVEQLIKNRDFEILLHGSGKIELMALLLVICMVNEENMGEALKVLVNFKDRRRLLWFMTDMLGLPHLKQLWKKFFAEVDLSEIEKRLVTAKLLNYSDYMDYYPLIRKDAKEVLVYLNSFVDGAFAIEMPANISSRDLFEFGLIYNLPETVLYALMAQDTFINDENLLFMALNSQVSSKLQISLINLDFEKSEWWFGPSGTIKVPVDVSVYKRLAQKWDHEVSIFGMIEPCVPHMEYLKVKLEENPRRVYLSELDSCVDASEMRLEYFKWHFSKGYEFQVHASEIVDFFEAHTTDALLNYIPKDGYKMYVSSYGKAACTVLSRENGLDDLVRHFGDPNAAQLQVVKLLAQHPSVVPSDLVDLLLNSSMHIAMSRHLFLRSILLEIGSPEFSDKIFKEICSKGVAAASILGDYILDDIDSSTPICRIFPLRHITADQLQHIIRTNQKFISPLTNNDYYGPRLIRIFAQAGLVQEVLRIIVLEFHDKSYSEIANGWPALLPYLPSEPSEVNEMITAILESKDTQIA